MVPKFKVHNNVRSEFFLCINFLVLFGCKFEHSKDYCTSCLPHSCVFE
jgi:hypothetical protein